jgi:ribosome modulation factor
MDPLDQAHREGWTAGDQGYPRESNPHPRGTALREWWDAGWSQSLDDLCGV